MVMPLSLSFLQTQLLGLCLYLCVFSLPFDTTAGPKILLDDFFFSFLPKGSRLPG